MNTAESPPHHLSTHSARHLYNHTLRHPLDLSAPQTPLPSPLPTTGVTYLSGGPEAAKSLWWVDTIAAFSSQREECVAALRRGEIPRPVVAPKLLAENVTSTVHLASPELLLRTSQTVLDALDLTSTVLAAARASTSVACPTCGERLRRYRQWSELFDDVARGLREEVSQREEIRVTLHGECFALETWGARHGFSLTSSTVNGGVITLDTFSVEPASTERAARDFSNRTAHIVRSLRTLPNSSITLERPHRDEHFALSGYCARCRYRLPPVALATLRSLLTQPRADKAAHETQAALSLDLSGVELQELLYKPSDTLLSRPSTLLSDIKASDIAAALSDLSQLSCGDIHLAAPIQELSPTALATVAIVRAMRRRVSHPGIVIVDLPCALFRGAHHAAVMEYMDRFSQQYATIVLSSPGEVGDSDLTPHQLPRTSTSLPPSSVGSEECIISLFPPEDRSSYLLIERLSLYDSLVKLFVAGRDAKESGIQAKSLSLRARAKHNALCESCLGVGLLLEEVAHTPRPHATLCPACEGKRFRSPVRELTFRGRTLWELLNSRFCDVADSLRALPRAQRVLEVLTALTIDYLPLGMPIRLLSSSERRLVSIAVAALSATQKNPITITIEEPFVGFSTSQQEGVLRLISTPSLIPHVMWGRLLRG